MYSTKKDISYSHIVILWFMNVLSECIQKLGQLRLLSPKARIEVLQRDTKNWGIGRRLLGSSFDLYSPINIKKTTVQCTVYTDLFHLISRYLLLTISYSRHRIKSIQWRRLSILIQFLPSLKTAWNINRNIEKLSISRILLVYL